MWGWGRRNSLEFFVSSESVSLFDPNIFFKKTKKLNLCFPELLSPSLSSLSVSLTRTISYLLSLRTFVFILPLSLTFSLISTLYSSSAPPPLFSLLSLFFRFLSLSLSSQSLLSSFSHSLCMPASLIPSLLFSPFMRERMSSSPHSLLFFHTLILPLFYLHPLSPSVSFFLSAFIDSFFTPFSFSPSICMPASLIPLSSFLFSHR